MSLKLATRTLNCVKNRNAKRTAVTSGYHKYTYNFLHTFEFFFLKQSEQICAIKNKKKLSNIVVPTCCDFLAKLLNVIWAVLLFWNTSRVAYLNYVDNCVTWYSHVISLYWYGYQSFRTHGRFVPSRFVLNSDYIPTHFIT